ncbi:TPA: hypothetical protein [Aquificae Joseph's Coat Spring virus]|nr:TPA: hypothetical protein [Aquificae Joseph's Coat Spring virus]
MKITYLTDEPTIAKTLIAGVLGAPQFKIVIDQYSVRVSSKDFWFDIKKDNDTLMMVSTYFQPLVIKSYISMQRLKHCIETELNVYLKRYYSVEIKEEDGVINATAVKR